MDFQDLKKLVKQGENQHLEFKLKATHPEKISKEMVAFANADGGILLLGVDDDRIIKGVKYPIEDEYVLEKAFSEYITPQINYTLQKINIEKDREVLVYFVPKSTQIHYLLQEPTHQWGRAYVRVADKCVRASREMRNIMKGRLKDENIKFQYGEKETALLKYLAQHSKITLNEYIAFAKLPPFVASKTLITLVLANVLLILPNEVEDEYVFNES
jgi:predicted HTH transcriptional regulator